MLHRSSKDIQIDVSKCSNDWKTVVEDTLPTAINVDCLSIPEFVYDINEVARHIRFIARSFYGIGPTLQYLHLDYDYPSGVVENNDLCPGMKST